MTTIGTLGPQGSHADQAARQYDPQAQIKLFPAIAPLIEAFSQGEVDLAVIPVYNTREGEIKEYFRVLAGLSNSFWLDNVVLPIHISLGSLEQMSDLTMLVGRDQVFRQCEEYITDRFPGIPLLTMQDMGAAIHEIQEQTLAGRGVIAAEETLKANGLTIREREVAPHNRTRFAVLGKTMPASTGYDATAIITHPLKDRVGLLFDILGEFTKRGINLLDLRSKSDIKTQELQIYIEMEGHAEDPAIGEALTRIEQQIIQEPGAIRVLGSFPRVDMREKIIRSVGFIGTGAMSEWFARKLENEGYRTLLTGRSTSLTPEEMIPQVDVVAICVPISVTSATVEQYGGLLRDGQALILLAGEAEGTLATAMEKTSHGVELMLIHNLWGPKAATMKDKNVSVVRTPRSGAMCSEVESFLYKHGADISHDSPARHDLLMGVGQKLPTTISTALAMTLKENEIAPDDIGSHSTLTSLYGILAMARIHAQNPRTYGEIMATGGEGRKIVRDFAKNLLTITELAEAGRINELCTLMADNSTYLTEDFLETRMRQALAVDETLGKILRS